VSVQIDPARHVPHAVEDRLRHRYRHSRTEQRRPLFPDTARGWLLLIGLLLVPILTMTLLLGGHSSADPGSQAGGPAVVDAGHTRGPTTAGSSGTAGAGAVAGATDADGSPVDPNATGATTRDPTIPLATLTGYWWPLAQPMITNPFGPSDWGNFFYRGVRIHDGVDMASWCGDNVMAAHDGTVLAVGTQYDDYLGWIGSLEPYKDLFDRKHWWSSLPLTIVIDDGNGFRSIYAHESKITVKVGQKVKAGQVIGYEGATGNATGCHVHYGLFSPDETATFALDPDIVAHDLLPGYEIARVNPLYVLPFRCEIEEMRALFPDLADPCPPLPTPTPKK
jgi:murein DD-endopeptidase MepM/ murein hydrolase activator NlpD